ncbi:MAG: sugar phosphate isomerase/epimerase [Clostridia bacterium]|nr:sugar phosphate isomerase/epimerase [Clostridia bacterium]
MRIGLSAAAFYGRMETEDQAAYLTQFAPEVCEVFLETHSEYAAAFGQTVKTRLNGIPCVSVHPKGTQFEPDLFGQSPRQRADARRILCGALDAGQALGAKWYVWHGPPALTGPIVPGRIRQLGERFPLLQQEAQTRGMEILWENVSWCALRRPEDVYALRDILPGIRFTLDIKQALRAGVDPLDMLRVMGGDIRHVHVLDWDDTGALCLPGQGTVDFRRLMQELRAQGYDGSVIIEPYTAHAMDADALRRSLDFLREAAR